MPKIPVVTPQKVTIEYETASLQERGIACIIDLIIIAIATSLLFYALIDQSNSEILGYVIVISTVWTYTLWNEIFFKGQTIGKKAMKIKVVKLNGEQPMLADHFGRWMFRLVDIYFSFGVLASFMVGSSSKGQRLGDVVTNTTVIKDTIAYNLTLKEILNLNTLDTYKPVYPEVIQLKEADMLLLKEVVDRYDKFPNKAHEEALHQLYLKMLRLIKPAIPPHDRKGFLKVLLKDYVVLTR